VDLYRGSVAQRRVQTLAIVEHLDVIDALPVPGNQAGDHNLHVRGSRLVRSANPRMQ
jgi:hypothetical protein